MYQCTIPDSLITKTFTKRGVGHNGHTVNKSSKIQSFIKKSFTLVRHAKIVILTQKVILGEINI